MENTEILYKSFLKFIIAIVVNNNKTLKEAKKIVTNKFAKHPNKKLIHKLINDTELGKKTLATLSNNCLAICEDFGSNRNYITLVMILKTILSEMPAESKTTKVAQKIGTDFEKKITEINASIDAPPLYNMFLEGRSLIEWSSIAFIYPFIPKFKSNNKDKPVLLMPPYLGNDYSTVFVRKYLKSVGFKTYKWELGLNMINSKYLPKLIERLDEIYEKHQEKVSLVGWSGGGIFAKIIANRYPDKVAQLITIGSPVWGINNMETPMIRVFEFLRGKKLKERNKKFLKELEEIPNVPITCIYTKTDGLIPWKHCKEATSLRNNIKNIEVYGSHCGLGANATVLRTVAKALNFNTDKEPKGIIPKIENLFYPKFWRQKGTTKFTNLFLKT
ncbi:MAG: alpha/beta hydrolase [Flavobacteriaceae bacterium]|nr:alpha/beta hydrolase [Flavobacteriaceae bacterium]